MIRSYKLGGTGDAAASVEFDRLNSQSPFVDVTDYVYRRCPGVVLKGFDQLGIRRKFFPGRAAVHGLLPFVAGVGCEQRNEEQTRHHFQRIDLHLDLDSKRMAPA